MTNGFQLGRLFRTDIYAAPGFLFLLALAGFLAVRNGFSPGEAAAWLLVITVSILVHEFGHVFAVRRLLKADCIVILSGFGGLTVHPGTVDRARRIAISLAGPVFGFALGGLALAAQAAWPAPGRAAATVLALFVWANVVWTAVNLLPIHPLDGGQALAAALEYATTPARARAIVRATGIACCAAGIYVAIRMDWPFAAVLAALLLAQNLRLFR